MHKSVSLHTTLNHAIQVDGKLIGVKYKHVLKVTPMEALKC